MVKKLKQRFQLRLSFIGRPILGEIDFEKSPKNRQISPIYFLKG